jgi:hypothetical protein
MTADTSPSIRSPNQRPQAEQALIAHFAEISALEPDSDFRLADLRPLAVETIDGPTLDACLSDISQGDGSELRSDLRPNGTLRHPRLHSIFSSCGAALNTFGPWRRAPQTLELARETGFEEMRLEEKLRIFRGGKAPNLDCVVWNDTRMVAVESKLCEHLQPGHTADFKPSYDRVAPLAHDSWASLYDLLKRDSDHFVYLDVAQLVRHYFGVRAQIGERGRHFGKQARLLYLYWEPSDADKQPTSIKHREEVGELRSLLSDPQIPFTAMSYRELWESWSERPDPPWLAEHVRLLRQRYDVALAESDPAALVTRRSDHKIPVGISDLALDSNHGQSIGRDHRRASGFR